VLGLVQGVTEVVPVSSSAHLTLVPWLLGWPPAPDRTALAAGLHAGSCAGIALALRAELRGLDRRTAVLLATATLPAAAAGALAADAVERRLGRPPQLAALLAGAGVLLWAADRRPARVHRVGPREAAVAGLAQVLALAPGVSRSGAVLTGLRAAGVRAPPPRGSRCCCRCRSPSARPCSPWPVPTARSCAAWAGRWRPAYRLRLCPRTPRCGPYDGAAAPGRAVPRSTVWPWPLP